MENFIFFVVYAVNSYMLLVKIVNTCSQKLQI